MNWDQVEGQWKQFTGEIQRQWGKLSGDDLDRAEGNREKLEGQIQEQYGVTKEEASRQVDEWLNSRS